MSEKKPKYCYGSQNYIELVCGVKVEPAPRSAKPGVNLRADLPEGWKTSATDVWRERGQGARGSHFMLMMAAPSEKEPHGKLIRRLGSWMDGQGLALVECVCVKGPRGNVLGAIVERQP